MDVLREIVTMILTWEARLVLARYKPRVIAVTGSVGKSTTKDAIFAGLAESVYVRKSEKSLNSDTGVPLAILGLESGWRNPFKWLANIAKGFWLVFSLRPYPEWLVLEVGADRPGDIRKIAQWLKPDIVVVTAIPDMPAHVEFFESSEEIMREKLSLAENLKPGGTLVLYGDNLRMMEAQKGIQARKITFGLENYNDLIASHDEIIYENGKPVGTRFRVNHAGSSIPVSIFGALGRPPIYAGLAALAVGTLVGVDFVSISKALGEWAMASGRLRILPGLNGSVIIDDTYNSSPAAAFAALDTLKSVAGAKRRIAILGDMLELGKWSGESHRKLGERAAECADMILTVGIRAREIAESTKDAGMREKAIRVFNQNESAHAGKELARELREGDLVLVKGSQGMRMERAVLEIMAEPERAHELLVRQEPEWLKKS
ncbi:MAG: UDP-N-acetylmuramoyl-tripeptide--D-alanyl-D-alanine ligase [bacterium]|nr:UDP-N-acetylmuramoyl-tripeptide--D-alanyl-D-alanine ligase [bacterium]